MPTNCTTQDWLKLITNLAIPIIISAFTIFISIHQQNLAESNRNKDLELAIRQRQENLEQERLQREEDKKFAQIQHDEDKNLSQIQRNEDKELAHLQRVEDAKTAELQRENDKELARLQRNEDREIARLQCQAEYQMSIDKRLQESELAEKQRQHEFNILQQNYNNDRQLKDEQQNEQILINYQRQLTKLILDYQIISNRQNSSLRFVLQMRTRTALRLLNSQRRTILIQTFCRATLFNVTWKEKNSLLYRTNLTGVQFGLSLDRNFSKYLVQYDYLDIRHADVRYATFYLIAFENVPIFTHSNFDFTDWSFSELDKILFSNGITLNYARFYQVYGSYLNFSDISMNYVSFENNKLCMLCSFNEISMLNANLFNSSFKSTKFISVQMTHANISHSYFSLTTFQNVILDYVDFSYTTFTDSIFKNVSMLNCSLLNIKVSNTRFINVNVKGCIYDEYLERYME